ncbi:MAG: NAD(P)/FAD-dependent oxidoreductase [Alkalispirochaetaceae bacterium]
MNDYYDAVIVGAGIAGVSAARTIRELNADMSILLVNGEDRLPYKRTKVSKHIRTGYQKDEFALYPSEWYEQQGIELQSGELATDIDRHERTVAFKGGGSVRYGKLLLSTGSEPLFPKVVRPHESDSFFVVRHAKDGERLLKSAQRAKTVLISGMGVLSVELASELSAMGKDVTLIGATAQLIPKQLNLRASEILEDLLSRKKVKLFFQEEILSFEQNKKRRMSVQMIRRSGNYDMVVICIGVQPRLELATRAGLETNRGIRVNEYLQTSDADIYCAGDAAEHPNGYVSHLWHAAEYQGVLAGKNIAGEPTKHDYPPFRLKAEVFNTYFFSVNKPRNPLDYEIEEFEQGERYWALFYKNGDLSGMVMVNDRDRAQEFERAVREGWSREQVHRTFAFA